MPETVRAGVATIEIDDRELLKHVDRVSGGAASTFVQRTRDALEDIEKKAIPRWPVRTGRSARGFFVRDQVRGDHISASLQNKERYVGFIRYSVRTEASLDREAERVSQRGDSQAARSAIFHFWRARLTRTHGQGAPTERMAGRKVWSTLVDTPGKRAAKRLAEDLQDDLDRLAGTD